MRAWSSLSVLIVLLGCTGCKSTPTAKERRANAGPAGAWIALTGLVTQRCAIADVAHGGASISIVKTDSDAIVAAETTTPDGKFMFRIPREVGMRYTLRVGEHREALPDGEWLSFQARVSVPCATGDDVDGPTLVQLFPPDASNALRDFDSAIRSPDGVQSTPEDMRERMQLPGRR